MKRFFFISSFELSEYWYWNYNNFIHMQVTFKFSYQIGISQDSIFKKETALDYN